MLHLMKWTLLFATLMIATHASHGWNIGSKGKVVGPSIHTTYFLTTNNASYPVRADAYVGIYVNGYCEYSAIYPIGREILKTGNYIDIDAFRLRSIINGGYSCMSIYYRQRQLVIETFQLIYDGINYIATIPQTSTVTLL